MASDSTGAPRQHAYTGPALPQVPEPSHAERVRTLVSLTSVGMLSTVSRKHSGYPFGSLMPYALDERGQPLFLISNMAMHTQNVRSESKASLFVSQTAAEDGDPLGSARATLVGNAVPVPEVDLPAARELYLERHENSRYWVDFADFHFFRLQLVELYYVGGFGVMGWVAAEEYSAADPDPLATAAPGIISHMNADHTDAMLLLARTHARLQASEVAMTSVDRLGFYLRLKTEEGMKGVRINFPREVRVARDTRSVLIEMVQRAQAVR